MSTLRKNLASALSFLVLLIAPLGFAHAQQVQVNSADPSSAVQGTLSLDVAVSGNGFDNSAQVKFLVTGTTNPGGITVKKVVVTGSKKLVATIDVADAAVVNKFDIEVALTNGRKGKGTTLFAVLAKGKTALDPCVSPNVVTESTFPSFAFSQNFQTYLADAAGRCTRMMPAILSTIHPDGGDFRYNAATNVVMIVAAADAGSPYGTDIIVAGTSSINFGPDGPAVSGDGALTTILNKADLPVPADLASAGWVSLGPGSPRISPDGRQLLLKNHYWDNATNPTAWISAYWTCDLSYDTSSRVLPVDPLTCREIHRGPLNVDWDGEPVWGVVPGTIYTTEKPSGSSIHSLYRLTLQQPPAKALVEEIFRHGDVLSRVRVSAATAAPDVSRGELVAVQERSSTQYCQQVFVIDAYRCAGLNCPIVNQKGMRSVTWLPDGRLAGRDQTAPDRRQRCYNGDSAVTYPAIDPNGTPATILITPPIQPNESWGPFLEGSTGGW